MAGPTVMVRIMGDAQGFSSSVDSATKAADRFGKAADSAGKGFADAAGKSQSVWAKAGDVLGSVAVGIGRAVSTAFVVGAGAAAAFGAAVVRSGVSYNTLYQTSSAAFRTILGSGEAATQMMDQLAAFAKTSPFPRQAFIEATQQMLAFGFSSEKVIPTLDAIQNAVAATGGSAAQIGEIADILSKVTSTGKFTAQTLNELGFRGIDAAKLIGQGMGMTAEQVRSSITAGTLDAGKAMDTLVAQMSTTFAGAAAGVKATWEGARDRVSGAMRDIGSAIVEPFISRAGGGLAIEWANKFADLLRAIEPLVAPLVDAVMNKLGPILQRISPWIDSLIQRIQSFGQGGTGAIQGLMGAFSSLAPVLGLVAPLMLKVGGANLGQAFGPLGGIIEGVTGKLGGWVPALIGMVLSTEEGRQALSQIIAVLGQLMGPIGEVIQAFSAALGPVIAAVMPSVVALIAMLVDIFQQLVPVIMPVIDIVKNVLVGAFQALQPVIMVVVSVVGQLMRALGPPIVQILTVLGQAIKAMMPFLVQLGQMLGGFIGQAFQALMPVITQIANILATIFTQALQAIMPILMQLARILLDQLAKLLPVLIPIISQIAQAFMQVLSAVMPLIPPLLQLVSQVFQALMPILPAVAQLVLALVQAFLPLIPPILQLVTTLVPVLVQLLQMLLPPITMIITLVAQMVAWFVQLIVGALGPVISVIGFLANVIINVIVVYIRIWMAIIQALIGFIQAIASTVMAVVNAVIGFFGNMVSFFAGIPGRLASIGGKMWDFIKDGINAAKQWVIDRVNDIVSFFTGIPGKLKSAAGNVFGFLEDAIKAPLRGIARLWNSTLGKVSFEVPGWVPGLGGKGFSFPKMPELARGAYLTQPTLALVAEAGPEIVSPVDTLRQVVSEALGGGTPGPAVVIQHATFTDEADIDLFLQRVSWAQQREAV